MCEAPPQRPSLARAVADPDEASGEGLTSLVAGSSSRYRKPGLAPPL